MSEWLVPMWLIEETAVVLSIISCTWLSLELLANISKAKEAASISTGGCPKKGASLLDNDRKTL